jgi:two-component system, response regulator YesN
MYNVMIVDDEPVIRFGLKASIDWQAEGLYLIGDYPNGEEALKAIEGVHPDILITDIKMPLMDGITLMKHALAKYPQLKVILVSSYNDFEYVREGLKLGAVDYILKPTLEPEDFVILLRSTVEKLREEKNIESKLIQIDETHIIEERRMFESAMKRVIFSEEKQLKIESLPSWLHKDFLMVYIEMNHALDIEEKYGLIFKSYILDEIQNDFYQTEKNGICFAIGDSKMLFLVQKSENDLLMVQALQKRIEEKTNLSFSFSFMTESHLASIRHSYLMLQKVCEHKFFNAKQSIFLITEYEQLKDEENKTKILPPLNLPLDNEDISEFISNRIVEWRKGTLTAQDIKKDACAILSSTFMKQISVHTLLEKCHELNTTETLEELISTLERLISECNQQTIENKKKHSTDNELIDKALDYIHQNYTEEMTLQRIADHIHISRNYFSIIFKKYIDKNFIDYVIELRVNKAKELLAGTALKIYEVAEKSGFNDVKYFSKVFKKLTGFSPVDFRAKNH